MLPEFLGGLSVYFVTGRLQGYPLCEIDFFLLIGFQLGIDQNLVTPKNWLPQKLVTPKIGYPQKKGYPKKWSNKMVTPKILAYFITRGFIIAFRKNGVLYCRGVYYCDSNIRI